MKWWHINYVLRQLGFSISLLVVVTPCCPWFVCPSISGWSTCKRSLTLPATKSWIDRRGSRCNRLMQHFLACSKLTETANSSSVTSLVFERFCFVSYRFRFLQLRSEEDDDFRHKPCPAFDKEIPEEVFLVRPCVFYNSPQCNWSSDEFVDNWEMWSMWLSWSYFRTGRKRSKTRRRWRPSLETVTPRRSHSSWTPWVWHSQRQSALQNLLPVKLNVCCIYL